jgi:hypothetical protein
MSDTRVATALRTVSGALAIIGGLLLGVSAFLPWITSTPFAVPASWHPDTVSGMDDGGIYFLVGRDGIFVLVGGALIAALGLWTTLSRFKAAPILLILSGLAFGLFGLLESDSIRNGFPVHQVMDLDGIALGQGIRWIYAGAAATFLAGLILIGQLRAWDPRRVRAELVRR